MSGWPVPKPSELPSSITTPTAQNR
jgi:hypothetical protein